MKTPEIRAVIPHRISFVWPVTAGGVALVIFLAIWFRAEFSILILGTGGLIIGTGSAWLIGRFRRGFVAGLLEIETIRQARATTHRLQIEAEIVETRHGVFVDGNRLRYIPPTVTERRALESGQIIEGEATETQPLDLLTVFTQLTQSYAIIGGQQTGKTYQAQHVAAHWIRRGIKPIVIGPKWDRGEWAGCILFGGGGDYDRVADGIALIRQIVEKRHADLSQRHKDHKPLPVFFDDWTPIVDSVDSARRLVLEATTLFASVNVVLYFILHADTAHAWGVDRKGAALKDNFVKLFIVPQYDPLGMIIRGRTTGYIRFAGESVDRPTRLINEQPPRGRAEVWQGRAVEAEPTDEEQRVLDMHASGESLRQITLAVWGKVGAYYNDKVNEIVRRNGGEA